VNLNETCIIQGKDGEWTPFPDYLGCCDCGLIHRFEVRSDVNGIYFRAYREDKLTEQSREMKDFPFKKEE
jgi:hypothetical protein